MRFFGAAGGLRCSYHTQNIAERTEVFPALFIVTKVSGIKSEVDPRGRDQEALEFTQSDCPTGTIPLYHITRFPVSHAIVPERVGCVV